MSAVCRGGAGPKVLLMHGLGGSPLTWDRFEHAAGDRLQLWDAEPPWTRGGTADWTQGLEPADWVARALSAVDGGFDLVIAHSFAANVLLEHLSCRPGPSAVLVSPFFRSSAADFDWQTLERYVAHFHEIFDEGLRVLSPDRPDAQVRDWMARRARDQVGPYGWIRFFDSYLRTPFVDLSRVKSRVLVVAGDRDAAAPAREGHALAALLPDGGFKAMADCGHFPMAERPDPFTRIVLDFLDMPAPERREFDIHAEMM